MHIFLKSFVVVVVVFLRISLIHIYQNMNMINQSIKILSQSKPTRLSGAVPLPEISQRWSPIVPYKALANAGS